jgi:hypothetical protein
MHDESKTETFRFHAETLSPETETVAYLWGASGLEPPPEIFEKNLRILKFKSFFKEL